MKRQLFAFIFAVAMSVALNAGQAYGQSGETIRVEIPFEFSANNQTIPAGTYLINPASEGRAVWRIHGTRQKVDRFLLGQGVSTPSEGGVLLMTFRRYGSKHFLAGFRTLSYEVRLPTSASEKKLLSSPTDMAKVEMVTIAIVSQNVR
jgi:hypothetical protein